MNLLMFLNAIKTTLPFPVCVEHSSVNAVCTTAVHRPEVAVTLQAKISRLPR